MIAGVDDPVTPPRGGDDVRTGDVVLVTRPVGPPPPGPVDAVRGLVVATLGAAASAATGVAGAVGRVVGGAAGQALDAVVPRVASAVVGRIDLTDLVVRNVDLGRVVTTALDSVDLTRIVVERVDIDAVVEKADMNRIIDRVPVIPLANFVIEEIDLPTIIKDSTGGIATDAVNAVRVQGVGADQFVSRLADRFLLRRRGRKLDAPGEPESLEPVADDPAADAPDVAGGRQP
jgi:hypothetical protein